MNYPIIIIEGCDASGKSTLANQIMKKYPNHVYIHNAVTSDIEKLHRNTLQAALLASEEHVVIIDRLHMSEDIYGRFYRNKVSYDTKAYDLAIDNIPNAKKILCIVDKETCLSKHDERLENEMFKDVSKIYDMYAENNWKNWIKYNWKTDSINLETFEVTKKEGINE